MFRDELMMGRAISARGFDEPMENEGMWLSLKISGCKKGVKVGSYILISDFLNGIGVVGF